MKKRLVIGFGAAVMALFGALPAHAAGFSFYEQSAKASAQAGAWVARADDAAANWYNPAALVRLEGAQLQFGANMLSAGSDLKFTMNDAAFASSNVFNGGTVVAPGTEFEGVSNDVWPAHFFFSQRVNERWAVGVGVTTPFGLVTEWKDAPLTYTSQKADLLTIMVNPNVAFAVGERASLAFGIDYIYADLQEFSRQTPVERDGVAPYETIGRTNLTGTGGDFGWNAAWHYAAPEWSMGLTYRSSLAPKLVGNVAFSDFGTYAADYVDSPAEATINLPASMAMGLAYTGLKRVQFEFDLTWMQWSRFQQLTADIQNNSPYVQDIVRNEDWSDSFAARAGADWAITESNHLRLGLLLDQNPIPTQTLRPTIPDADRTGYTLGYGFNGKRFQLDAYWMHLAFADRTASGIFTSANPGPNDGVIDGTYENSVDIFGITAGVKF